MYLLILNAKLSGFSTVESSGLLSHPQRLRPSIQTVPMKTVSEVQEVINDVPREECVEEVEKTPYITPTCKKREEKEQFAKEHKERPDEHVEHEEYVWPKKPFKGEFPTKSSRQSCGK